MEIPMIRTLRLTGLATLAAVLVSPSAAQRPSTVPSTWAITGARIVPVSGRDIAKGTIVIRNGLIEAVGANVEAPAGARLIDGTGMTVYPGFIDSYGSLGLPSGNGAAGGNQGGQATPAPNLAPNSRYAAGMQAEIRAVDLLAPPANAFKSAREAGFTAALTAQARGIFRGTSALISLSDNSVNELVVADGVTQNLGFSRGGGGGFGGGGGYPSSLMGVFAQLRQQLLDAGTYRDARAAYARDPNGKVRPSHDPTLEALQPVLTGERPVIFAANTEREIRRALSFSKEFGLNAIIAGGTQASGAAEELASAGVPVLVNVDFPRKTAPGGDRTTGGGGGGRTGGRAAAADTPESMRVLRDRVERPKVAGRLAAAGVQVALVSGNEYGDFVSNLRRAVAGGMSADDVLKSITLVPATMFGVADRLGTIEAGKIANLTIVSGDLFAEGGEVSQVFVDGARFDFTSTAESADSTETPAGRRTP
jgi:imidazolonepropionase-like amidohydrolase